MQIRQFEQMFASTHPISIGQIRLRDKDFSLQQLHTRQKKWWIQKLMRWWWVLPNIVTHHGHTAAISNSIYEPSYLSLERALRYYNLIPEWVYMCTACTTKKTQQFHTSLGTFAYQTIAPKLFWGYTVQTVGVYQHIRIASPEKTLCDYSYLHPEMTWPEDFEEMRINSIQWQQIASEETLRQYADHYPKATQQRIAYFLDYITHA